MGEFIHYNVNSFVKAGRILAFVTETGVLRAKIQKLLQNHELPRNFQSTNYDSTQLWMTDDVIIVSLSQIISKISVWLEDTEEPFQYDYKISKILYSFNNHYKMRPITFRHYHLNERINVGTILPPPPEMQVLKIFIDLYYDDFGTFRTSYHS